MTKGKRIKINGDRCCGCMICMNVCSFFHENACSPSNARLNIYMDPFTGEVESSVSDLCDQCGGRPECVRWCPMGALKYTASQ